ncbi:methyl-accepting chemotaxis protein [Geomonas agri]|uniref:methyl-accepting chemotaxis protein n=1 Tax=Geomonas agri TaxID=2873702 RepID=UPI001CD43F39|nr:methyl-accepting chemotaxis protein [Geomonas agri]
MLNLNNLSMRNKLLVTLLPLLVLLILGTVFFAYKVSSGIVRENAYQEAALLSRNYGSQMAVDLENAMTTVRVMSQQFAGMDRYPAGARRDMIDAMMKQATAKNDWALSFWCIYEPNALDGLDAHNVNKVGSNDKGRFTPGYFKSNGKLEPSTTTEADAGSKDYYLLPKKRQTETVLNPYWDVYSGDTSKRKILMTSCIVPIFHGTTFVGVVGVDIELGGLSSKLAQFKPLGSGYAFLAGNNGELLAYPTKELLGKNVAEALPAEHKQPVQQAIATGKEYLIESCRLPGSPADSLVVFAPLTIGKATDLPWSFAVSVPVSSVLAKTRTMAGSLTLVGCLALCCLAAVIVLVAATISKPLRELYQRVSDIAEGEGDLTRRIDLGERSDEVGLLAGKFNLFVDKMRLMILDIAEASRSLAADSLSLNGTSSSISVGAEEVASQTVTVATASEEMAATAADIASNCHLAADGAKEAADATQAGFRVVSSTVAGIRERGEMTRASAKAVTTLGERSEQIGAIVATIEDIADQTNLLALNAAIEAARAGEQGRGFAVVADEVRALAERTTRATKEIGDMIKAIQQETRSAITAMEEGVHATERGAAEAAQLESALSRILEQVNAVSMQVSQIATAAEEQTATTSEITSNIQSVTSAVQLTAQGAHQTATTASQLAEVSGTLQGIVAKFKL